MKVAATILIIILAVIVLSFLGYVFFAADTTEEIPDQATENGSGESEGNVDVPASWRTLSNQEFQIVLAYPGEATASTEVGRIKILYIGPTSEMNTELTDGFTFYVHTEEISGNTSVQSRAQEQFEMETERLRRISEPHEIMIGNRTAYEYEIESELGSAVTHVIAEADPDTIFAVSYSVFDPENRGYQNIINMMLRTLQYTGEEAASVGEVSVALLDTEFTGEADRGCDRVVFIERGIATTTMPLTAALQELFSLEEERIEGFYNFMANTNNTLSFERAAVEDGTAHIYLSGNLSGLAGVCDDPRAQIQIEETALQFPTVDDVVIYLNGEEDSLTPSQR